MLLFFLCRAASSLGFPLFLRLGIWLSDGFSSFGKFPPQKRRQLLALKFSARVLSRRRSPLQTSCRRRPAMPACEVSIYRPWTRIEFTNYLASTRPLFLSSATAAASSLSLLPLPVAGLCWLFLPRFVTVFATRASSASSSFRKAPMRWSLASSSARCKAERCASCTFP